MSIKQFIIAILLSIGILIGDYRLEVFERIKFFGNMLATPISAIADFPVAAWELLNPREMTKNQQDELLQLQVKLQKYNALLLENQRLLNLAGNNLVLRDESFSISRILHTDKSRLRKHITISHGLQDNVAKNDIVIGEYGVLGVVLEPNISYSIVRLITDPLQYIPVVNTRSGEKAIAKGRAVSADQMIVQFVRPDADVMVGDIYATSGEGLMFGYGYTVGRVIDILATSDNFLSIILAPVQDVERTIFAVVDKSYE